MNQGGDVDELIEDAVQLVPNELQDDLRDWLVLARQGEFSPLRQEMLGKAEELWRAFDNASKEVEKKLQQ